MIVEILMILVLSCGFFYWQAAQKVKEIALAATKQYCQQRELQMLDGYIALSSLKFQRNVSGKLEWRRTYRFEFSATGLERYNGEIMMLARKVISIQLEPHRF